MIDSAPEPTIEKHIARTLLLAPSERKLTNYQTQFQEFFAGRWPQFDQLIASIADFFATFGTFPPLSAYEIELTAANDESLLQYIRAIAQDELVLVHHDDADFAAALRAVKNEVYKTELMAAMRGLTGVITGLAAHLPVVQQGLNTMLTSLYTAQQRALGSDAADTSVLFGKEAQQELREHYQTIKVKRLKGDLYHTLPFRQLAEIQIKQGDLIFVGAYTSQGKSLLLRALAYHFLIEYGLNVAFWSMEISRDATRTMFVLLHANNKERYPNTPIVPVGSYKEGTLTDEQEDFLVTVSNWDLTENPNFGTLLIEQPNKPDFSLTDLTGRLRMIEQTKMPVHVLVIDYITHMSPVPIGRLAPVRNDDYNFMIHDLKRLCLTYRNREGKAAPLICLTAAQISRKGLEEAMKRDGLYDLQAFSTYTEIERSADIALTSLMTPEMRNLGQLKLQVLKNRDGVVPTEPLTLHIDFAHGFHLQELHQRTFEQIATSLRSLAL